MTAEDHKRSGQFHLLTFFFFSFLLHLPKGVWGESYFGNESEIVVTGTKEEKILADTPVKTEVFTDEQIEDFRPENVAETMKYIPGISLQGLHGRGGSAPIIQGLGENHTLLLINGVPRPQTSTTGHDLSQFDVPNIKRIEVVKGASSSLYGGQAMGGVINIITKKPAKKRAISFDARLGSPVGANLGDLSHKGSSLISGNFSQKMGAWSYDFYGSYREYDHYDLDTSSVVEDGRDQDIQNYSLRMDRQGDTHHFSTVYSYLKDKTRDISSAQNLLGEYEPRFNRTDVQTHSILGSYIYHVNRSDSLEFKIQYNQTDDKYFYSDDPRTTYRENDVYGIYKNYWLESQYNFEVGSSQNFVTGLVLKYDDLNKENISRASGGTAVSTKEVDKKNQNSLQAYIQDDIILGNWEFVPGIRGNYSQGFGFQLAPKIGFRYDPDLFHFADTNLRASLGRGYRVPNLKERFYLLDHSTFGYMVKGNESLQPEESMSYQMGTEWNFKGKMSIYLNLYLNEIKNLIDYDDGKVVGSHKVYSYQNIGRVQTRGTELSLKSSWGKGLSHQLSYTYTRAKNKKTGKFLTNRPFHIFQNSLIYEFFYEGPSLTLDTLYRDNEYTSEDNKLVSRGYFQWDILLNLPLLKKGILYLGIDNIFNKTREPRQDGDSQSNDNRPDRGRYFFMGINIKIS